MRFALVNEGVDGLIKPPAPTNRALLRAKDGGQNRPYFDGPTMNRDVIDEKTALLHHLRYVTRAQRLGDRPAHACEHHLTRIVPPFENLTQCAVDLTLAEIEHGADCHLGLLQHNLAAVITNTAPAP